MKLITILTCCLALLVPASPAGAAVAVSDGGDRASVALAGAKKSIQEKCPELIYLGIRGDGEAPKGSSAGDPAAYKEKFHGMGETVSETLRWAKKKVGHQTSYSEPVVYPALPLGTIGKSPRAYARNVLNGATALRERMALLLQTPCLSVSRYVLLGYSSGAWAIRLAVNTMPARMRRQIQGVVVYGDPSADSNEKVVRGLNKPSRPGRGIGFSRVLGNRLPAAAYKKYPKALRGRVRSYCHVFDPVCRAWPEAINGSKTVVARTLRQGRVDHDFYALKNIEYSAGVWLGKKVDNASLFPQTSAPEMNFRVGRQSSWSFAVTGKYPPFTVTSVTTGFAGGGLTVSGTTISGVPTRADIGEVEFDVVDAVGRHTSVSTPVLADYPTLATSEVAIGRGQDSFGRNVTDPSVSQDGRLVAFGQGADGLVPGDTNGHSDVYVRSMATSSVSLVSQTPGGGPGNGDSGSPDISSDGSMVVFSSQATDLVAGSLPNGIYGYDLASGAVSRLGYGFGPSVSADGSRVAYVDQSGDLVLLDGGSTTLRVVVPDAEVAESAISGDGHWIVFSSTTSTLVPGDTNGYSDVFLVGVDSGAVTLVSRAADGAPNPFPTFAPSVSGDGKVVAYGGVPNAGHFGSVYRADTTTWKRDVVAESTDTDSTSLSADGQFLAYSILSCRGTAAAIGYYNAANRDNRGVWDTRPSGSGFVNGYSTAPDLSADGRYVAFANVPVNGPIDVLLSYLAP